MTSTTKHNIAPHDNLFDPLFREGKAFQSNIRLTNAVVAQSQFPNRENGSFAHGEGVVVRTVCRVSIP